MLTLAAAPRPPLAAQARAVKRLLAYRLPGTTPSEAKAEWYSIVEGRHALWGGVSEPYKHMIRAFLVHFQLAILSQVTAEFNFSNGSIGEASSQGRGGARALAHRAVTVRALCAHCAAYIVCMCVAALPAAEQRQQQLQAAPGRRAFALLSWPSLVALCRCPACRHCVMSSLRPGNFFFAGARTFFRSLESAVFLFRCVLRHACCCSHPAALRAHRPAVDASAASLADASVAACCASPARFCRHHHTDNTNAGNDATPSHARGQPCVAHS